jgi:hypothetical protein
MCLRLKLYDAKLDKDVSFRNVPAKVEISYDRLEIFRILGEGGITLLLGVRAGESVALLKTAMAKSTDGIFQKMFNFALLKIDAIWVIE